MERIGARGGGHRSGMGHGMDGCQAARGKQHFEIRMLVATNERENRRGFHAREKSFTHTHPKRLALALPLAGVRKRSPPPPRERSRLDSHLAEPPQGLSACRGAGQGVVERTRRRKAESESFPPPLPPSATLFFLARASLPPRSTRCKTSSRDCTTGYTLACSTAKRERKREEGGTGGGGGRP